MVVDLAEERVGVLGVGNSGEQKSSEQNYETAHVFVNGSCRVRGDQMHSSRSFNTRRLIGTSQLLDE